MKNILILLASILFPICVFAQGAGNLSGPHATVQTDGTQTDGSVNLITNNAGPVTVSTNKTKRVEWDSSGYFKCTGNACSFLTNTADAADSSTMTISGGGAVGATRGAAVSVYGNESSGTGAIIIGSGNPNGSYVSLRTNAGDTTGYVDVRNGASQMWKFTQAGTLSSDSTNGSHIVFNKELTGIKLPAAVVLTPSATFPTPPANTLANTVSIMAAGAPTANFMNLPAATPYIGVGSIYVQNLDNDPIALVPQGGTDAVNGLAAATPFACTGNKLCECRVIAANNWACQ